MSCLDSIVTLGICPDEMDSQSGFKLIDAGGMSIKNFANTATETYTSGIKMVMAKKRLAILQVRNDFIGALQSNNVVTTISQPTYDTSVFNGNDNVGISSTARGVNIYKVGRRGSMLRTTYIKSVQLYPLNDGEAEIIIEDGNKQYTYAVSLVANQVNIFSESELTGFPFAIESNTAKITVNAPGISFAGADITCKTGCNGGVPNPCAYADGFDGSKNVKSQGYGINVQFYCDCNYEKILCDLAKGFSGELIWLKWQIAIYDEVVKSNRFNNWVIYNSDEIKETILPDLKQQYNQKWNDLMNGMLGILKTYGNDECLNCQGVRWATNV